MRFSQQLALAAALASVTSAIPLLPRANSTAKTFSVSQVTTSQPNRKPAGPVAMSRAIGKYAKVGAKVPEHVEAAAQKVRRYCFHLETTVMGNVCG